MGGRWQPKGRSRRCWVQQPKLTLPPPRQRVVTAPPRALSTLVTHGKHGTAPERAQRGRTSHRASRWILPLVPDTPPAPWKKEAPRSTHYFILHFLDLSLSCSLAHTTSHLCAQPKRGQPQLYSPRFTLLQREHLQVPRRAPPSAARVPEVSEGQRGRGLSVPPRAACLALAETNPSQHIDPRSCPRGLSGHGAAEPLPSLLLCPSAQSAGLS